MRNTYRFLLFCGLLAGGLLTACTKQKNYPSSAKQQSIMQYLAEDTTLSLLYLAMQRAGMDSVLTSGGPYTLFAPTDSAFVAGGLTASAILTMDTATLRGIVGYHLLRGQIGSTTTVGFIADTIGSLNGRFNPIISQNYYGLFINGIQVTVGNIGLADGLLHKIGQVAFPPGGTLLQTLQSLPNATMAAYIYTQSVLLRNAATDPADVLAGKIYMDGFGGLDQDLPEQPVSMTLLIPTDAAFKAAGYNSIADLAALAGPDTVTRTTMVAGGTLLGSFFVCDFMGGRNVGGYAYQYTAASGNVALTTMALSCGFGEDYNSPLVPTPYTLYSFQVGSSFEFGADGISIYGNNMLTPPRIIQPNIVTSNGVIHLIDQVYVPQGQYIPGGTN